MIMYRNVNVHFQLRSGFLSKNSFFVKLKKLVKVYRTFDICSTVFTTSDINIDFPCFSFTNKFFITFINLFDLFEIIATISAKFIFLFF